MTNEYQRELFEEFKKEEPALKKLAKKVLPQKRPHIIQIPLEGGIVSAILVLLLLIIAFAIGVETGKKQEAVAKQEVIDIAAKVEESSEKVVLYKEEQVREPEVVEKVEEEPIDRPYTIQLIAYKDKRRARAKVKDLEAKGDKATIIERKGWFQICVGSYLNKQEAEKDLRRLSSIYNGCFLREKEEN